MYNYNISYKKVISIIITSLITILFSVNCNAQSATIGINLVSDLEIHTVDGRDHSRESDLVMVISENFDKHQNIRIVSNRVDDMRGVFLVQLNIVKPPDSDFYIIIYTDAVKFLLNPEDLEDPNAMKWVYMGNMHFITSEPEDALIELSNFFEERIFPILNIRF